MDKNGFVYILFNEENGTLYTGSTYDIIMRVAQHKTKHFPNCFTAKYGVDKLGYWEECGSVENAIMREKQIKSGNRNSKLKLIHSKNPDWIDLYDNLVRD